MLPPPLPHQISVLQKVLDRIDHRPGAPDVVAFDLDGTIFDGRVKTLEILMEYADEVRDELPDVAEAITSLDSEHVKYLLSDTLRECGLVKGEVVRDITNFWRDRFFIDDYCVYDAEVPGALEYLHACREAGATICYVVGRDAPGMLLGTVSSLRDHGFPVAVSGVELILKPDATMAEEAFKRGALPQLRRCGNVIAYFDNEPANCNLARELFPSATTVLVDTQRVPGAPEPAAGVEMVSDFRHHGASHSV